MGGKGWTKLAELLSKKTMSAIPKPGISISKSEEIYQMWEKEVVIVARNHNSRLPWNKIAETLKLDVLPFCDIKAAAPVGSIVAKQEWLTNRMMQIQQESLL